LEISIRADQLHPALRLLAARPEVFARQGHIAASLRTRNGKTFGPYYRLAYRDGDRQRSIYLGRDGELVEQVSQKLETLQRPRKQYLALQGFQRKIRQSLRVEKNRLSSLLRPYGLRLKGSELRGLRLSSLRPCFPRRRLMFPRLSSVRLPAYCPVSEPPQIRLAKFLEARDKVKL
jgi:hypothetical protein